MRAYSSAIKFTLLIPGNVCVQDEGMVKPMYWPSIMSKESYKKINFSYQIVSLY